MTWTEKQSVGVRDLDEDHKQVFAMINDLSDAIAAGYSRETLESVLAQLMHYTKIHLAREEEYFAQTKYPQAIEHKMEHDRMVKRVQDLIARFFNGGSVVALSLELVSFLRDWWASHIERADKMYSAYFNFNGIH
jgi:hemerythrin